MMMIHHHGAAKFRVRKKRPLQAFAPGVPRVALFAAGTKAWRSKAMEGGEDGEPEATYRPCAHVVAINRLTISNKKMLHVRQGCV